MEKRLQSNLVIVPNVVIVVRRGDDDRIIRTIRAHNLIVDTGLNKLRDLVSYPDSAFDPAGKTPAFFAVGTGTTAAAASDTALGTEVFRSSIAQRYPQTKGIEFYLDLRTTDANDSELTEVGLFSEPEDGNLWSRCVHAPITKNNTVTVQYHWTWTLGTP